MSRSWHRYQGATARAGTISAIGGVAGQQMRLDPHSHRASAMWELEEPAADEASTTGY